MFGLNYSYGWRTWNFLRKVAAFVISKPAGKSSPGDFQRIQWFDASSTRFVGCIKSSNNDETGTERRQFLKYCCLWDETLTVCTTHRAKSLCFHHIYNRCDVCLHVYSVFFGTEMWLLNHSHESFGFASSWDAASSSSPSRHTRRWSGVKPEWTTTHTL